MSIQIDSINPSDKSLLGRVEATDPADLELLVDGARSVQKSWGNLDISKRIELVCSFVDKLEHNSKQLSKLLSQEMGMPIGEATYDVLYGLEYFRWYLDNAEQCLAPEITKETQEELHQVIREPHGVVVSIAPWNFPFSNFVWLVGQALLVGNSVLFKHSEEVVLFQKELQRICINSDIPDGVLSFVYGDGKLGSELLDQDIDLIVFTGSTEVGDTIRVKAAEKRIPCLLELGGSAPGIVFEDADLDMAVQQIYFNRFLNCGQVCDGLKRLIIHESVAEKVIEKLMKLLQQKQVGDATQASTEIGPLVSEKQLLTLESQVEDAVTLGAEVLLGGERVQGLKGYYFEPTLLRQINPKMKVWKEEVFGPVLPIVTFSTYQQALNLANDTQYGLGAYVFTASSHIFQSAAQDIGSGMVSQNEVSYVHPFNPFGGYKDSGLGREHGRFGFEEVTKIKVISSKK